MHKLLLHVAIVALSTIPFLGVINPQAMPQPKVGLNPSSSLTKTQDPSVNIFTLASATPLSDIPQISAQPLPQISAVSLPTDTIIPDCGSNIYANDIFMSESSCNLDAVNPSSGDYGLGQSAGGLATACPDWRTDYTCQNTFFDNYALSRYGSWAAAWAFHQENNWW